MGGFFNLEGPFARFGNILADIMFLGILWLLFSLPVVTAGAATTAVFYITTRRVSNKEGYIFRDFWKSFRMNFKQATICWLIILMLAIIFYINVTNIDILGSASTVVYPLQLCFAFELILVSTFAFPLISRFELSLVEVFKNAFFMANRHMLTSLTVLALGLAVLFISYVTIIFSFIAMGVYAFVSSYLFMRVFKKYRPEMDDDEFSVALNN